MRALSIQQPWADRILFEGKDIENRSWRLPAHIKGQRIYIHAGLKPDPYERCTTRIPTERLGVILGEITIVDCVTESESEWFYGPYGFRLGRSPAIRKADPLPRAIRILQTSRGDAMKIEIEVEKRNDGRSVFELRKDGRAIGGGPDTSLLNAIFYCVGVLEISGDLFQEDRK